MLINNNTIFQNDKPISFRHVMISYIDHLISNCPIKLTNITTYNNKYICNDNPNISNTPKKDLIDSNNIDYD